MRRAPLLTAVTTFLLFAGCTPLPSTSPGEQPPPADPGAVAPTEETALPAAPAGPFDAAALSTQSGEITSADGYKAALSLEWFPAVPMTTSQLPASCVSALSLWSYQPSWTDADVSITAVPVRISAQYPAVNGFTWPEDSLVSGNLTYDSPTATHKAMGECIDGVEAADIKLPSSSTGGGSVEAFAIFFEPKTPNNPDGAIELNLPSLSFVTNPKYDWTCNEGPERSCVFPHP